MSRPAPRDRAIFVGNPDDIVPDDFGPGAQALCELVRGQGPRELHLVDRPLRGEG